MRIEHVTFLATIASKSTCSSGPISSTSKPKRVEIPSTPLRLERRRTSSPSGVVILRRRFCWVKSAIVFFQSVRDAGRPSDLLVLLQIPATRNVAGRLAVGPDHRVLELDLRVAEPDLFGRDAALALARASPADGLEEHLAQLVLHVGFLVARGAAERQR